MPRADRHRTLLALLLVATPLLGGCLARNPRPVVRGPLPSRPQHPLGLTFLAMRPRVATTQPRGSTAVGVQAAYSSIFEANAAEGDRVVFDGEVARGSVFLRHGLAERVDVEVEVGVAYGTSGFMDGVLDDFHGVFFLPQGGRDEFPRDQYDMSIQRQGATLYELEEDRVGLTDTPLIVTGSLVDEDVGGWRPAVALRAGVELPTGSESAGFGSGGLDWGAGFLLQKSTGRFTWTAAADVILPDDQDTFEAVDIDIRDFWQLQGGSEFRWSDVCSVVLQLFVTTPYTSDIVVEEINREIVDLGVGVVFDVAERSRVFVSFHEDLVAATGPDFGLRAGWTWGF